MNVILKFTSTGLFLGGWPEGVDPRIPGTKCIQADGKLVSPIPGIYVNEGGGGIDICIAVENPEVLNVELDPGGPLYAELKDQLTQMAKAKDNALSRLDDLTGDLADAEGTLEDIERILDETDPTMMTPEEIATVLKNIREAI